MYTSQSYIEWLVCLPGYAITTQVLGEAVQPTYLPCLDTVACRLSK